MTDIARITAIFFIILLLLRLKWNIGLVLITASGVLSVIYFVSPSIMGETILSVVTSRITIELLLTLAFIRMFEMILRDNKVLANMMESVKRTLRNKRGVIVSMPLLIGMMPSVGGAYFSAPMVGEAAKGLNLTPEDKTFTNYWYRHPWELVLPLYPGIILTSLITNVDLRTLITLNSICALSMLITGSLWGMKGVRGSFTIKERMDLKGLLNFSPIVILITMVMLFQVSLHYALIIMTGVLLLYYKYRLHSFLKVLTHGFSKDIIILIVGVMLFKEMLTSTGAVENISTFLTENKIPITPILFLLPFVAGMLTGLTVGFVGATFPLLVSLAGADPHAFAFAFVSGYVGVLISPVHVCLILTREYFGADIWGAYKKIIPASMLLLAVAAAEYAFRLYL